jgi:hypothetical protein
VSSKLRIKPIVEITQEELKDEFKLRVVEPTGDQNV